MAVTQSEWRLRAKRLVDSLVQSGALSDLSWYDAFAATPRHLFVPSFFVEGHTFDGAEPADLEQWLDAAYRDDALLTQTSRKRPTSSSSKPAIMAVMLSLLEITDTDRVLEIGTGTGYNAALLTTRLGSERVTSIDIDPALVDEARARLTDLGAFPVLVAGDGFGGCAEQAPYDRIIATCAVRQIPPAWIGQLAEGGRIVAPLTGPGGPLMVLDKTANDEVSGHFDSRPALFMPLRHAAGDPLGPGESVAFRAGACPTTGQPRSIPTGSSLGQPAHDRLGITALDVKDRQFVWLDDPNGTHSWPLR